MRLCLLLSVNLYIYPAKEGGRGEVELQFIRLVKKIKYGSAF